MKMLAVMTGPLTRTLQLVRHFPCIGLLQVWMRKQAQGGEVTHPGSRSWGTAGWD